MKQRNQALRRQVSNIQDPTERPTRTSHELTRRPQTNSASAGEPKVIVNCKHMYTIETHIVCIVSDVVAKLNLHTYNAIQICKQVMYHA